MYNILFFIISVFASVYFIDRCKPLLFRSAIYTRKHDSHFWCFFYFISFNILLRLHVLGFPSKWVFFFYFSYLKFILEISLKRILFSHHLIFTWKISLGYNTWTPIFPNSEGEFIVTSFNSYVLLNIIIHTSRMDIFLEQWIKLLAQRGCQTLNVSRSHFSLYRLV